MQKNFKNKKTSSRLHFKTKRVRTGRKIGNKKNFLPIRLNPTRVRKFKYKCRKILKIKKTPSRLHFKTKQAKTGRKIEKKNNFLLFRSNPTRVRKFKNKCRKILKIKKHHPGFISRRNRSEQAEKKRIKNISSLSV